jgi:hypothetical protein
MEKTIDSITIEQCAHVLKKLLNPNTVNPAIKNLEQNLKQVLDKTPLDEPTLLKVLALLQ